MGCLNGKAFTAAALILDVGVVEAEEAIESFADVIHFAAVQHLDGIGGYIDAGPVGLEVHVIRLSLVGKIEHVAVARTAAGFDGYPKAKPLAALFEDAVDLLGGGGEMLSVAMEHSP